MGINHIWECGCRFDERGKAIRWCGFHAPLLKKKKNKKPHKVICPSCETEMKQRLFGFGNFYCTNNKCIYGRG